MLDSIFWISLVLGVLIYLLPNKSLDKLLPPRKFSITSELLFPYWFLILFSFLLDWVVKLVSGKGVLSKYPALLTPDEPFTPELVVDPVAFMYIILEDLAGISGNKC